MKREDRNPRDVFVMPNALSLQDDHPNLLLFSIFDYLTNTAMMPTNLKGQLPRVSKPRPWEAFHLDGTCRRQG
jgi:hypothetical protein